LLANIGRLRPEPYWDNKGGDATQLVDAVRQARAMGYRRVILAGQSAGGWVSMAATMRGAPVDGVISVSAAHHGEVKNMSDVSRARSEWQQVVRGIRPGPRLVVVNFRDDTYDVGGRMDDAKAAFAASGVDAIVISNPEGFTGTAPPGVGPFRSSTAPASTPSSRTAFASRRAFRRSAAALDILPGG
jgi:pimeloyl-ACP methyl ester carboxylesterase